MIGLNIEDPVVLRRTLEELFSKIPTTDVQLTALLPLADDATLVETVAKVNELIDTINVIVTAFNYSDDLR